MSINMRILNQSSKRGTTIIELMIAIAVIVILAGLAMVAVTATSQMSAARETETMMRAIKALQVEYETQSGDEIDVFTDIRWKSKQVHYEPWNDEVEGTLTEGMVGNGENGTIEPEEPTPPEELVDDRIERYLWPLTSQPRMNDYLRRKGMQKMIEDFDGDGFPELKDSWGKQMRFVKWIYLDMDGEQIFVVRDDPDDPGAPEPPSSDDLILHRDPDSVGFLISAGPDGYFGDEDPKFGESGWDDEKRKKLARKHAEDNIVGLDL